LSDEPEIMGIVHFLSRVLQPKSRLSCWIQADPGVEFPSLEYDGTSPLSWMNP
jgi:hypothetical protein